MELGLLSHIVSKDNGIVNEWIVRRKIGHTFIDIIVGRGQVPVDYKYESLMCAVKELLKNGHQITEIKSEMDSTRRDIMVTLQLLPGTVTKGMRSTHLEKETYEFDHGRPVGSSGFRKRILKANFAEASVASCSDVSDEDEGDGSSTSKMVKLNGSRKSSCEDNGVQKPISTGDVAKETTALGLLKLSRRMRKMKRKKLFKKKLAAERLVREVGQVADMVGNLQLYEVGESKLTSGPEQTVSVTSAQGASERSGAFGLLPNNCDQDRNPAPGQAQSWVNKNINSPYTSEDDKEFQAALTTWQEHTAVSGGLSGLGFTLPAAAVNQEQHGEREVNNVMTDSVKDNFEVGEDLISSMEELDLEAEVTKWFEMSKEEEDRLLDAGDADDLLDLTVEEINEGLSMMIFDIDKQRLRFRESND